MTAGDRMEMSHTLLLNEDAYKKLPPPRNAAFLYEWLTHVQRLLAHATRADISRDQTELQRQLLAQLKEGPGAPAARLLADCLAQLFSVGDTTNLFSVIGELNDLLKLKEDNAVRQAATTALGSLYSRLGRLVGRSHEETAQLLLRPYKQAESGTRRRTFVTLAAAVAGLGSAGAMVHKEMFKVVRQGLADRSLPVRGAAADCLKELATHAPLVSGAELETVCSLCLKAMDGSNYELRRQLSKCLAHVLFCATQQTGRKPFRAEDALIVLQQGFQRGGVSGFLRDSAAASKELRLGISQTYVELVSELGSLWLDRNLTLFSEHCLLLLNARPASHLDTVHARRCVLFVLASTCGRRLSEQRQALALRDLAVFLNRQLSLTTGEVSLDSLESARSDANSQVLAATLLYFSILLRRAGQAALSVLQEPGVLEAVQGALSCSATAVQLSSAWCLRSVGSTLPSLLAQLIHKCLQLLRDHPDTPDAITGAGCGIAALLGAIPHTSLGVPTQLLTHCYSVADTLLHSASKHPRLSIPRVQAGWLILSALVSLDSALVAPHLSRLLMLWKSSFPRSNKEFDTERQRGDTFTWHLMLEMRSGALCALQHFVERCPSLVTTETQKKIVSVLECALGLVSKLPEILKLHGAELKAVAAQLRWRVYNILLSFSPTSYEGAYSTLLRELVAEFTLTDSAGHLTTSLLPSLLHPDDRPLFGETDTDHSQIEDQLQPTSASGCGALEHDWSSLFSHTTEVQPLPLGVAVIDASVRLFGAVFPHVAAKHRLQLLEHFVESVRVAKPPARQQAVQLNVLAALLSALRRLVALKQSLAPEARRPALQLAFDALSAGPLPRCAAAEAAGRLAQTSAEQYFVSELGTHSADQLRNSRDVAARCGHALALGCLHRYVGSLVAAPTTKQTIVTLISLSTENASPQQQVWTLHALSLVSESPLFRPLLDGALTNSLQLTLGSPASEVAQALARLTSTLVTALGPELSQSSPSLDQQRAACLTSAGAMLRHPDPLVKADAIGCFQQLHLFAPRQVCLTELVAELVTEFRNDALCVRRQALACLRQLAQREPEALCTPAHLPNTLFAMLDIEVDSLVQSHTKETLAGLISLAHLSVLREVISHSADVDAEEEGDDAVEEGQKFHASKEEDRDPAPLPRWSTRLFALTLLHRLVTTSDSVTLLPHLGDLMRLAFISSTTTNDAIRLQGLSLLSSLIDVFASVQETEMPGHSVLESYQAQVVAAVRPAFAGDCPPDVTAAACQVCSVWIGSGVARDDIRRVRDLLSVSLEKVSGGERGSSQQYGEVAETCQSLAILSAWAELSVVCDEERPEQLPSLWVAALRDQAVLQLPDELLQRLADGTFYRRAAVRAARPLYAEAWPALALAAARHWPGESDSDDAFLLLGLAMETLAVSPAAQPVHRLSRCLSAAEALLAATAVPTLAVDRVNTEILHICYRLLITRELSVLHEQVLAVVRQLLISVTSHPPAAPTPPLQNGDVATEPSFPKVGLAAESVEFAALEICHNLLTQPGETSLIPQVLQLLPLVAQLHEAAQPVCLHLCVGAAAQHPGAVKAAVKTLHQLCGKASSGHLLATLTSLLTLPTTDRALQLDLLTVVLLAAPPLSETLQDDLVQIYCQSWHAGLRLKVAHLLRLFLASPQVNQGFLRALTTSLLPACLLHLRQLDFSHTDCLAVVSELLNILEHLLDRCSDSTTPPVTAGTQPALLSLLISLTVPLLMDQQQLAAEGNATAKSVHMLVLKRLVSLGPRFPTALKLVLSATAEMKQRLEAAIRHSQGAKTAPDPVETPAMAAPAQPKIQLKMDFSAFAKK